MKLKKYLVVLLLLGGLVSAFSFYYFKNIDVKQEVERAGKEKVIQDQPTALVEVAPIDFTQDSEKVVPHLFSPLEKLIFYTPQERQEFFRQQGIDYVNGTIVEYEPLFEYDLKQSDKYQQDSEFYDLVTSLYDDDIVAQTLMPMSIRWISQDVGHGVFAEEDLPTGGFVGVYGGVVKDRNLVDNKDYAWAYPAETLEGGRITLDALERGNELRLINDGKDPNCAVQYILGSDGLWHVCYLAIKDIKKGEQLLVSYGPAYWDTRQYKYQELALMQ